MFLPTIDIPSIALSLVKKLVLKQGQKYIDNNFNNTDKFTQELTGVINETMEQFRKTQHPSSGDKIAFYESQELFENLLNYSFFDALDFTEIETNIQASEAILPYNNDIINNFFNLFRSNLSKHPYLRKLETELRYKENIAKILERTNSIDRTLQKTLSEIDNSLKGEYQRQLNEIKDNIKSFQPKTALTRLQLLQQAILDNHQMTDSLQAKIFFLLGLCYEDLEIENEKKYDLYVKAFNHNKNDSEYKLRAAMAYLNNGDSGKSITLVKEILEKDEYNASGWFFYFILNEESFANKLNTVPKKVLSGKLFIPMLYNWLLSKQYIEEAKIIEKQYLNIDILEPLVPEKITYESKDYWFLIAFVNLYVYYHENSLNYYIINRSLMQKDRRLHYLHQIMNLIDKTFAETEIKGKFSTHIFYNNYLSYIFKEEQFSLTSLENSYQQINFPVSANLMALVQVLVTENLQDKALDYVLHFDPQGVPFDLRYKSSMQCILYKLKGDRFNSLRSLNEYIGHEGIIDEIVLSNIFPTIEGIFSTKEEVSLFASTHLHNTEFANDQLKLLFVVYLDTAFLKELSDIELDEKLKKLKSDLSFNDILKRYVAISMCNSSRLNDAILYLKPFINSKAANSNLFLYIKCLMNYEEADTEELLSLLKLWRENGEYNKAFLSREIYHRQYLEEWEEIEQISILGKNEFPDEEHFLLMEALAYERQSKKAELETLIPELTRTNFSREIDAINAFGILLKHKFSQAALHVIYKSASQKENKQSRQTYITNTYSLPEEMFKDYETVEIDSYVKYSIDNKVSFIHLTKQMSLTEPQASMLKKKIGDEFLIAESIGLNYKKVKIIRIMNKYTALFEEIIQEADNPYSGLTMKKIDTPSDDIKDFEKSLIENFGAEGSMRKQYINDQLKKYHNGEVSFTELLASVFKDEFVKAYSFLTSKSSEGFLTLPKILFNDNIWNNDANFILDSSSVLLFYELWKDLKISYPKKFFISPFIIRQLKEELTNLQLSNPSSMWLTVTVEGVHPTFYPDDFHQNSIAYLSEVIEWLSDFTEPLIIPKRVSYNAFLDNSEGETKTAIRIIIDNYLGLEQNYSLISNDFFYYRKFKGYHENIVVPQNYLEHLPGIDAKKIEGYLLQKRFIGIDLSSDIIYEEWLKYETGKENNYHHCLLNISYYYNPTHLIFGTAIRFLKNVYLVNWKTLEDKNAVAHRVFLNLLRGASQEENFIRLIRLIVNHEFRLMGMTQTHVIVEFNKALEILRGNGR